MRGLLEGLRRRIGLRYVFRSPFLLRFSPKRFAEYGATNRCSPTTSPVPLSPSVSPPPDRSTNARSRRYRTLRRRRCACASRSSRGSWVRSIGLGRFTVMRVSSVTRGCVFLPFFALFLFLLRSAAVLTNLFSARIDQPQVLGGVELVRNRDGFGGYLQGGTSTFPSALSLSSLSPILLTY
jgi:hypothetical protein